MIQLLTVRSVFSLLFFSPSLPFPLDFFLFLAQPNYKQQQIMSFSLISPLLLGLKQLSDTPSHFLIYTAIIKAHAG